MILEMKNGESKIVHNMKGGEKSLRNVTFNDGQNKIVYNTLEPGATVGYHRHEGNSEIIFFVSGKAKILMDDGVEYAEPGQCHYCPEGHSHSVQNPGPDPLTFFAVIPEIGRKDS
ncbi:cupin domain-containing protein [Clostridium vitabionis]|jgi:mannose-6-phosphate isomerase-like protein (cupin superfamily)|uniref:cupin domain-containing protein n=1 Tax=Clostridium vitabionis TaxID=2784388 RepID=UPI00188BFDF7|nr:cupin domain-containing protein [Clostridium vitabionis]